LPCARQAFWRQLGVCAQAAPAAGCDRAKGACCAVAIWNPEQGDRTGQDAHARLGQVAAGPDSGRVAGTHPLGQGRFDELGAGAPLGGSAWSAAEKKSLLAVAPDTEA